MLSAAGHAPVLAPLRVVEALPLPADPPVPDRLIATSRNAFLDAETLPAIWRGRPIHCVGEKTAEAARAAGFARAEASGGDLTTLVPDVRAAVRPGERLLYLAGETRKPDLEITLRAAGHMLVTLPRYRMRRLDALPETARRALVAGACDAALHFSAESAAALFDLARAAGLGPALAGICHACLSPAVARRVEALGGDPAGIRIAEKPDAGALVALLRADFR